MDLLEKFFGVLGLGDHLLVGNLAFAPELDEVAVEGLHAPLAAGLDVGGDAEGLVVAYEGADGGGGDHDLEGGDAAGAVLAGHEGLGDDGDEGGGELGPDLLLLVGGEGVDDAVDGAGGAGGVEGGEDEVAGFGGGDGRLHGLEVAHFADEDDVRVLAEGAAEGLREGGDVDADFALGDDVFWLIRF